MKTAIVFLALLTSSSTMACKNFHETLAAYKLFKALPIIEQPVVAPMSEVRYQKAVSGIECIRSKHITTGDTYNCHVDLDEINHEEIYYLLDSEELAVREPKSELKFRKEAGMLKCDKIKGMRLGEKYKCWI